MAVLPSIQWATEREPDMATINACWEPQRDQVNAPPIGTGVDPNVTIVARARTQRRLPPLSGPTHRRSVGAAMRAIARRNSPRR
jgi:hypothetical protein